MRLYWSGLSFPAAETSRQEELRASQQTGGERSAHTAGRAPVSTRRPARTTAAAGAPVILKIPPTLTTQRGSRDRASGNSPRQLKTRVRESGHTSSAAARRGQGVHGSDLDQLHLQACLCTQMVLSFVTSLRGVTGTRPPVSTRADQPQPRPSPSRPGTRGGPR